MNFRALLLGLAALLLSSGSRAGETSRYAPIPPGLDAIVGDPSDESLAATALGEAEGGAGRPAGEAALRSARALLVLLGDVGAKHVAARLAKGDVAGSALPHLLLVLASADSPDVEVLLERAAEEERPEIRAIAATGLARGRTARAVPALARLAVDPVPSVRAAALRALFALDGPDARAARIALPVDLREDLQKVRLLGHRLRGDLSPEVLALARGGWAKGASPLLRTEAALLLAEPGLGTPTRTLQAVAAENGSGPAGTYLLRGVRARADEPAAMRCVAVAAAFSLLGRADLSEPERAAWVRRMVGWLARPVAMDPYGHDPVPEDVLRARLPDLGAAVLEPTLARLRENRFSDPRDGVLLLREIEPSLGLPAIRSLLTEEGVPEAVRTAAAGGLTALGVGDEALARRLLGPEERHTIRRDVVTALGVEPAAWAVRTLADELARRGTDLREDATDALEMRKEPEARAVLVEQAFAHPEDAKRRLKPLVVLGDDEAFRVLERALRDERPSMRVAGLQLFEGAEIPAICDDRGKALVLAHRIRAGARERASETQALVYALLAVSPLEAVRYVAARWEDLVALDMENKTLGMLAMAKGDPVTKAVVDLVLEKLAGAPTEKRLLEGLGALTMRRGWRDPEIDRLVETAITSSDRKIQDPVVKMLAHPGRGDLVEPLLRYAAIGTAGANCLGSEDMIAALMALRFQRFDSRIEALLVDRALDPQEQPDVRVNAAYLLTGRVSPASRERLLAWLRETRMGNIEPGVQHMVAATIGEGGGPEAAGALFSLLSSEIDERWRSPDRPEVEGGETDAFSDRVGALVRGIARTGDGPAMDRVVALSLDPRFAVYAWQAVRYQARLIEGTGTGGGGAGPGDSIAEWTFSTPGSPHPMAPEVAKLVEGMKAMDDAPLAASLDRVLREARGNGRLALFPDATLERMVVLLLDRRGGERRLAAAAVEAYVRRVEPVDGAADASVETLRTEHLAREGRFEEAATSAARLVSILARRGYDAGDPLLWSRACANLDALLGAARAQQGDPAAARDAFRRAVLHAPQDPEALAVVARRRAQARFDLPAALADATRAVRLDRRVNGQERLDVADALAEVSLASDDPVSAALLLATHRRRAAGLDSTRGAARLHLAEAYARAGVLDEADAVLGEALDAEPGILDTLLALPWAAPLLRSEPLASKVRAARLRIRQGE